MPPPPSFQDKSTQQWVIALCMMLVLLGSLALAWAVSGERRSNVGGLSLVVPSGWSMSEVKASGQAMQTARQWVRHADQTYSPKRLVVARLNDDLAVDADAAYQTVTRELTGRWDLALGKSKQQVNLGGQSVTVLQLMGLNRDFLKQQDRLHLLALVTTGERLWVIYLEETIANSGVFSRAVIPPQTIMLLDRIVKTIKLDSQTE